MTPGWRSVIILFTLFMCVSASLLAVRKLMSIDPTSVFT